MCKPTIETSSLPTDSALQADFVDLQNLSPYNKGYKYLLTCIDIFSKYAFVLHLKTKQGQELVRPFGKQMESQIIAC